MIPKSINNILKSNFVLWAFTIYVVLILHKLNQERKYTRIIVFCVAGLFTAYFSKNVVLSLIVSICAVWAFNYYRITYEPFLDKLDHMENILDDLESGFGNKSEGGSKILDLLATHKNLNTDEFKQDIFNVLDMGTESAEKDKLRKILSKDLKEQLSEVSEGLDKIKDLKDISKM